MKPTSGVGKTANSPVSCGFMPQFTAFFSERLSIDSVMYCRLIAAGVLLLGGIIAQGTWPAVSVYLWLGGILIIGCDTLVCFIINIIADHIITEELSVIAAVIFSVASGHTCAAAAFILFFRLFQQIKRIIISGIPDDGNSVPNYKEITIINLVFFTASLACGAISGFCSKGSVGGILSCIATAQICISPCILCFSAALADALARKSLFDSGFVLRTSKILKRCVMVRSVVIDKAKLLDCDELTVIDASSQRLGNNVLLRIAAHACAYSESVYAKAVLAAYRDTVYIDLIQSFQEDDAGITVTVDSVPIVFGLSSYLTDAGIAIRDNNADAQAMFLAINGEYAGRILFGDKPSTGAEDIASNLENLHTETILFTDGTLTAGKAFAEQIGIKRYFASPISKSALLRDLRKEQKHGLQLYAFGRKDDPACLDICDISMGFGSGYEACDIAIAESSPKLIVTLLNTARNYRTALISGAVITAADACFWVFLAASHFAALWPALAVFISATVLSSMLSAILLLRQRKK